MVLTTRSNVTANGTAITIPIDAMIAGALFTEVNGFPVTVSIGTTSGAADIVAATTVPANGTLSAPSASFSALNLGTAGPIYFSSTNWNGAALNIKFWYMQ
jgi:hypothetical protein